MLTIEDLNRRVDEMFEGARLDMLETGLLVEAAVLLNAQGEARVLANFSATPFRCAMARFAQEVRAYRTVAIAHAACFELMAVAGPAPAGLFRQVPQELRRVILAQGHWPARGHCYQRAAKVLRHGGVVDVAEMHDPAMSVESWIPDLLPHHG